MSRTRGIAAQCAVVALLVAGEWGTSIGAASATRAPATGAVLPGAATTTDPCGHLPLSSSHYHHVIWIWMENHSYRTIIGVSSAPFINRLARQCGLATNYHNVSHPSLPNYVAATSGLGLSGLGQFTSDCNPSKHCSTTAPSIFSQDETWKAYEESMPSNCRRSDSGEYAVRHNPPPYFSTLRGCSSNDVPSSRLAVDLARSTLPAFSFVTPNLIDDMHDGTVAQGDRWLARTLPTITGSKEYKTGSTAVFITWDEGEGGSSNNCAGNTTDVGCHVATVVVGPTTTPGTTSATLFNHYSLLRSAEELLGLPLLGRAATSHSMVAAFRL